MQFVVCVVPILPGKTVSSVTFHFNIGSVLTSLLCIMQLMPNVTLY